MNPPEQLAQFYKKVVPEATMGTSHVCLYLAFYQLWRESDWATPIRVHRKEVMELAKIASRATYHRCLKRLIELNCIQYEPSFDPKSKSKVFFCLDAGFSPAK